MGLVRGEAGILDPTHERLIFKTGCKPAIGLGLGLSSASLSPAQDCIKKNQIRPLVNAKSLISISLISGALRRYHVFNSFFSIITFMVGAGQALALYQSTQAQPIY